MRQEGINFIFLQVHTQLFQYQILKRLLLPNLMSHLICTLVQGSRIIAPVSRRGNWDLARLVTCLKPQRIQSKKKNLIELQGHGSFNNTKMGIYVMPADGKRKSYKKEIVQIFLFFFFS